MKFQDMMTDVGIYANSEMTETLYAEDVEASILNNDIICGTLMMKIDSTYEAIGNYVLTPTQYLNDGGYYDLTLTTPLISLSTLGYNVYAFVSFDMTQANDVHGHYAIGGQMSAVPDAFANT
jgi:hypothetical protein